MTAEGFEPPDPEESRFTVCGATRLRFTLPLVPEPFLRLFPIEELRKASDTLATRWIFIYVGPLLCKVRVTGFEPASVGSQPTMISHYTKLGVREEGLEPSTSPLSGERSNPLSYTRSFIPSCFSRIAFGFAPITLAFSTPFSK